MNQALILTSSDRTPLVERANRDLLSELLADKRSPGTRKAYAWDLRNFFQLIAQSDPTPALIEEFLNLDRNQALSLVLKYKGMLVEFGLAQATINRRLAAVKSLVNYRTVRGIASAAGIKKTISPHRIRHSAVTAALDATQGDVRQVQKLSRHANLDTLMIYDDNRRDAQGSVSKMLADLV